MTCDELLTYLSSYLDNELDVDLAEAARAHLATCQNCKVVLNTTRQVMVLGRGQGQRTIPAVERGALFTRLREAFEQRGR
jgi:anti-sigma factor RsiW